MAKSPFAKFSEYNFTVFCTIAGVAAGWAINQFSSTEVATSTTITVLVSIVTCLFAVFFMYVVSNAIMESINEKANIVHYKDSYKRLERCIWDAQSEVILVANFTYDWESDSRNFDSERLFSNERQHMFNEIYSCIQRKDVVFKRIYQRPNEYRNVFFEKLKDDTHYQKELDILLKTREESPHIAKLTVADLVTDMSFVIIDKKFFFLNVDIRDPSKNTYLSPFVLFVENPNPEFGERIDQIVAFIEKNADSVE